MTPRSLRAGLLLGLTLLTCGSVQAAGIVLRDDFSDTGSGWPNVAASHHTDLGFAVYTDSGAYQLTPVQDGAFGFIEAPKQADGGDVKIESDLFLYAGVGAGGAGIGCRFRDKQNFYAFVARGDAMVAIVKVKDGVATPLAETSVESIMAGTVDTRMTVECKGESLRLSANGADTLSVQDDEFSAGHAGLFVIGEKGAGTSGSFDNFVLTDLGG